MTTRVHVQAVGLLGMTLLLTPAVVVGAGEVTRVQLSGPRQVVDGWTRTNGQASFESKALLAHGAAWAAYDNILVRFDLSRVDPLRHARIKRAVLRLHVLSVQAPAKGQEPRPLRVGPVTVPWTTAAKCNTPDGTKRSWPTRQQHPNMAYAVRDSLVVSRKVSRKGKLEIDVTSLVERWLYQGMENHGLLLTASPPVFGRPNLGSWRLEFASSEDRQGRGPALSIEFEGTPPKPDTAVRRALAVYPSAALAPIRYPYYIAYYNVPSRETWKQLPNVTMTTYSGHSRWLHGRGVVNLGWAEGGPAKWLPDRAAWIRYYTGVAKNAPVGFCGHESNLAGQQAEWLVAAFKEAKRTYPSRLLAYYFRGEPHMAKAAGTGHIDLLIQEGYLSVHKQFPRHFAIGFEGVKARIDVARKHKALSRQIVMLGHICGLDEYHKGRELTAELLDRRIGELRQYAPEMPGIGFYGVGADPKRTVMCDRLVHKHFVAVAPDVELVHPIFGQELSTPHVTLSASAKARDKRKVVRYRWFVDNRLVAETSQADWTWDLRGEKAGTHVVSVHAIDDLWNRSASQVSVRVTNHRGGGVTAASR